MATTSSGRSTGARSSGGHFPAGHFPGVRSTGAGIHTETPPRPARLAPVWARMRGAWLDRELATGVEPWRSPVHSARSLQITSPRARQSLARTLDRLIVRAQTPTTTLTTVMPLDRAAVLDAQDALRELGDRLRDGAPVSSCGVAALRDLVSDGTGPIYSPLTGVGLARALASIRACLDVPD